MFLSLLCLICLQSFVCIAEDNYEYKGIKYDRACWRDNCMGTRTNPLKRAVQYIEWGLHGKGCCGSSRGDCDRCVKPDNIVPLIQGASSCYVDNNELKGEVYGDCIQDAMIYDSVWIKDKRSQKCATATDDGAVVKLDCDKSDINQIWTFTPEDGLIKNHGQNKCLYIDVDNSKDENISLEACVTDSAQTESRQSEYQQWDYHSNINQIRFRHASSSKWDCVDNKEQGHNYSGFILQECIVGSSRQEFVLEQTTCNDVKSVSPGACGEITSEYVGDDRVETVELSVQCTKTAVIVLRLKAKNRQSSSLVISLNDQSQDVQYPTSSDYSYISSKYFDVQAGSSTFILESTKPRSFDDDYNVYDYIKNVELVENDKASTSCNFILSVYDPKYFNQWCDAAFKTPLASGVLIEADGHGTSVEGTLEWSIVGYDTTAPAKFFYDKNVRENPQGFEPKMCSNHELCGWSQERTTSEMTHYSTDDGSRKMESENVHWKTAVGVEQKFGVDFFGTGSETIIKFDAENGEEYTWEEEASFTESQGYEKAKETTTTTNLACGDVEFKSICRAEVREFQVSYAAKIYPTVQVAGYEIDCYDKQYSRTTIVNQNYNEYVWSAVLDTACIDDPICAAFDKGSCRDDYHETTITELCPVLCAKFSPVGEFCDPTLKCFFAPIPESRCPYDKLNPRATDALQKCTDAYGSYGELCDADGPFTYGKGPKDWMIDNCIGTWDGIEYKYSIYRWTCIVDVPAASANVTLIKADAECGSKDNWVDEFRTVEECEEAVFEQGGTYFIYGKGTKGTQCYIEYTTSDDCPEGWLTNDEFDFYKVTLKPSFIPSLTQESLSMNILQVTNYVKFFALFGALFTGWFIFKQAKTMFSQDYSTVPDAAEEI